MYVFESIQGYAELQGRCAKKHAVKQNRMLIFFWKDIGMIINFSM